MSRLFPLLLYLPSPFTLTRFSSSSLNILLSWNPFTPPLFIESVWLRSKFPFLRSKTQSLLRPFTTRFCFPILSWWSCFLFHQECKSNQMRKGNPHLSLCSNLTIICIWKIYMFFFPPCCTGWDYAKGSSSTVYWIHWHSLHTRLLLWYTCYSLSPSKIYSSLLRKFPITI